MSDLRSKLAHASILTAAALGAVACQQDPFDPEGQLLIKKPEQAAPIFPAYSVETDDVLECDEGQACHFTMLGRVPPPGTPMVAITGLPAGAAFDSARNVVTWQPGFDAVEGFGDRSTKAFVVTVVVRSSKDPVTSVSRRVTFVARNKPRLPSLELVGVPAGGTADVTEGREFVQTVRGLWADAPTAALQLNLIGAPAGARVESIGAGEFRVRFTPEPTFTRLDPANGPDPAIKTVQFDAELVSPDGQRARQTVKWAVRDSRILPQVSAPARVVQGADGTFTVRAEDLNGEAPPRVLLESAAPVGVLTTEEVPIPPTAPGAPSTATYIHLRWRGVPASHAGSVVPLRFLICAKSSPTVFAYCSTRVVEVAFEFGPASAAPAIRRLGWAEGFRPSIRVGASAGFNVAVAGGAAVSVQPPSMAAEVTYAAGRLTVAPTVPGPRVFSLVATTSAGQAAVETFGFEALPALWSPTLVLAGANLGAEPEFWSRQLGEGDLVSAPFELTPTHLRERSAVIVTSEALAAPRAQARIRALGAAPGLRWVLSSPLLDRILTTASSANPATAGLPEVARVLHSMGLTFKARIPDARGMLVQTAAGSPLARLSGAVALKGELTAESRSPMALELRAGSSCRPLLRLAPAAGGGASQLIAAACPSSGQGAQRTGYVVLGFEAGDLEAAKPADAAVLAQWVRTWVKQ